MIHDNAWTTYSDDDKRELEKLSSDYIEFLNNGKTERECTELIVEMARNNGYRDLNEIIEKDEKLHPRCPSGFPKTGYQAESSL